MRKAAFALVALVALAAWALGGERALAQEQKKLPTVGFMQLGADPAPLFELFRRGLGELGYVEGRDIKIEARFAQGRINRLDEIASEFHALNVDVIVAMGAVSVQAARRATTNIPIVFAAVLDPIPLGYAESLERPGGNITGVSSFDPEQPQKQLELLKEVIPNLSRVAILSDQDIPRSTSDGANPFEKANDGAARALGLEPHWVRVKGPAPDLAGAFAAITDQRVQAVLVLEVPVILRNLKPIAELAAKQRLPTLFPGGWENDGLITYGTSILNTVPRLPIYVDKLLKGAKASELAIEFVTRRELIINLKTAHEIGVTIPADLVRRADRVVQ